MHGGFDLMSGTLRHLAMRREGDQGQDSFCHKGNNRELVDNASTRVVSDLLLRQWPAGGRRATSCTTATECVVVYRCSWDSPAQQLSERCSWNWYTDTRITITEKLVSLPVSKWWNSVMVRGQRENVALEELLQQDQQAHLRGMLCRGRKMWS